MLKVGNDLWAVYSSVCLGKPPRGADENRISLLPPVFPPCPRDSRVEFLSPEEGVDHEAQLSLLLDMCPGLRRPLSPVDHKSQRDLQAMAGFFLPCCICPEAMSTALTTCLGVGVSWEDTGEQKHRLDRFISQNIMSATPVKEIPALLHHFSKFNLLCVSVLKTRVTGHLYICAHTLVQIHACFWFLLVKVWEK